MPTIDADTARTRLLDAAEALFYARGVHAVGMDDIRDEAGVSLKRLYGLYPAKEQLVEAYLQRRDVRWRWRLAESVDRVDGAEERVLAVFDWLGAWFAEPGFRGCAWINGYGEMGATSQVMARLAREHKEAFAAYVVGLVRAAGGSDEVGRQVFLLAEGAMVTAGILRDPSCAGTARAAAATLLSARSAR